MGQIFPFKQGEWLKYSVNYGFINAGEITTEVVPTERENIKHIVTKGESKGLVSIFFEVKDQYESFFDTITKTPVRFIRNVSEGGFTINREIDFDINRGIATVHEEGRDSIYKIPKNVQDVVSLVCYLRCFPIQEFKIGQSLDIPVFVDRALFKFKIKLIGKETLKTKFGMSPSLIFVPFVKKGRIFKEGEGVKIWVSNDKNKIPLKLEVELVLGSLEIELIAFRKLSHMINFVPQ